MVVKVMGQPVTPVELQNCGNKVRRARAIALKVTYPEKFVGQDPKLYR